jgi:hypothetical protein
MNLNPFASKITAEWMREQMNKYRFTPDIAILEQRQYKLLFVYDNLMASHRYHSMLNEASFRGAAFTVDHFSVFAKQLGLETFPIALNTTFSQTPHARILGELYRVPSSLLYLELDKHMLNTIQFKRMRTEILIPYRRRDRADARIVSNEFRTMNVFADMYVGIDDYWIHDEGLSAYDFSKVSTFTPNCPFDEDYYYFTTMDCKKEEHFVDTSPFKIMVPEKTIKETIPLEFDKLKNKDGSVSCEWGEISSVRNVG